jgi:hypothetical protein
VRGFWAYVWATIVIRVLNVPIDFTVWMRRGHPAHGGEGLALTS